MFKVRPRPVVVCVLMLFALWMTTDGRNGFAGQAPAPAADHLKPVYGGTLTIAMPFATQVDTNAVLQTNLYEVGLYFHDGLFDWGLDGKVKPLLVKQKLVSADGLTVTWKLQPGVTFHDGTPFNAAAVKWNLERKIQKKQSPYDLLPFKTVEVVDELTARVTLDRPYPALDAILANRSFSMYSPSFAQKVGDDGLKTQQSGVGPFILTSFVPNEGIRLKKNPNYWQKGLPYLDEVYIRIVNDPNTRATMLAAGDADVALLLSSPDIQRFKRAQGIRVLEGPGSQQYYIVMNSRRPGLSDKRVRQAFNYAVDKEGIVQNVYLGGARVAQAMYATPVLEGFTPAGVYPYDPDKAKKLLDEAGWKMGSGGFREKDGKRLTVDMWTRKGSTPGDYEISELVQGMLKAVGVDCKLTLLEPATFNPRVSVAPEKSEYDMVSMGFNGPTGNVDYVLNMLYSSKAFPPRYYNRAYMAIPDVDQMIEKANNSKKRDEQHKLYAQILKRMHEEAPLIQLVDLTQAVAFRDSVRGIYLNGPPNNYPAQFAWKEKR
jgi:glutathione transport system substrate-binding protein